MRTTLAIQDQALDLCRERAQKTGRTLGEVVTEAIFDSLAKRPTVSRKASRPQYPIVGGNGLQAGVSLDSWREVEDVLDGTR